MRLEHYLQICELLENFLFWQELLIVQRPSLHVVLCQEVVKSVVVLIQFNDVLARVVLQELKHHLNVCKSAFVRLSVFDGKTQVRRSVLLEHRDFVLENQRSSTIILQLCYKLKTLDRLGELVEYELQRHVDVRVSLADEVYLAELDDQVAVRIGPELVLHMLARRAFLLLVNTAHIDWDGRVLIVRVCDRAAVYAYRETALSC